MTINKRILICIFLHFLVSEKVLNAQARKYQISHEVDYVPSVLIVKFKSDEQKGNEANQINIEDVKSSLSIKSFRPIQFGYDNSKNKNQKAKSKFLSNIYKLTLGADTDLNSTINKFLTYDNVIYAEPLYYEKQLLVPDDPNIASQDHLSVIKAYEAWDVTTGNSELIIGVVDSGIQLDHQDLSGQVVINASEITNGFDDDGNGFIDDLNGWDFADDDNDPTADNSPHGTRVAGISNAQANNGVGIAGVGYSSKVVPLKIFTSANNVSENSYEAIIYAADQGYDVINLSWGSVGTFSQFNQDVINYAAIDKDVVIVAAAGNTNAELDFYPASYDNVLSVGASDINDNKASFATYGYNIDIMAPGESVFSSTNGNSYNTASGSSFSTPQVAGAAALVRDVFPELNALQVMQQLRITTDDIYSIGNNNLYEGQLGTGRLNVLEAVSENTSPALRMHNFTYAGTFGEKVFFDDTVKVNMSFTNYLRNTLNATASITTASPYISFISPSTLSIGSLGALETLSSQEFIFYINENAPPSEPIAFRIDFSDDNGYTDFQYFVIELEPDYLFIENSSIGFTVSSNGNLGYAIDTLENGSGFQHNGVKIADNFGIIIANHQDSVSNNVIRDYPESARDTSFLKLSNLKPIKYDGIDLYAKSEFNDSEESEFSLGLHIEQEVLAWNDGNNEDFLIVEYRISNTTAYQKTNLEFGFYADWNLIDSFQNKADWDESNSLGYVYDSESQVKYAGTALLSSQLASHHATDVRSENGNTSEIDDDFSKIKKYNFITSPKLTAGDIGTGNDVASLLIVTIGTLDAGQSEKIALVLSASGSLSELQSNVQMAQSNYDNFLSAPPITLIDTACVNEDFTLNIPNGTNFDIFDDAQMSNLLLSGNDLNLGSFERDSIIYYRNSDGGFSSDISSLKIIVSDPMTDFQLQTDTLYLGDNPLNQVQFTDLSIGAVSWSWDFGNGALASTQNPKIAFNEEGLYQIDLSIVSATGCNGFVSKTLLVAQRSADPTIENQTICNGDMVSISASDATNLKFYINELDETPAFEGIEFTSGQISRDTVFYVSSVDMIFESHKVPVAITIDPIKSNFSIRLDTLDLTQKNLIILDDLSNESNGIEWYSNDMLIGTAMHQDLTFSDQTSLSVKQKVISSLLCEDSLTQVLDLIASPLPQAADTITLCKFDSTIITPNQNNTYYFYTDRTLSNLIHKGSFFKSGQLMNDSLIYITNVSNYRESEADSVLLRIIPFETEIQASPEFLIIENGRNVEFSSTNQSAIQWRWYLEDDLVESVAAPILKFDTAGIYDLELVVKNIDGCLDTAALVFEVRHVTGFDFSDESIQLYPNPVGKTLTIDTSNGTDLKELKFYNSLGARISVPIQFSNGSYQIDVSNVPSGIYLFKSSIGSANLTKKIIVNH